MSTLSHLRIKKSWLGWCLTLTASLSTSGLTSVVVAQDEPKDGVKVGKMSLIRLPTGILEPKAAQQYQQEMQTAAGQRALAPDNHPQLIRLRNIAKRIIPFADDWNERAKEWQWEVNLLGSNQVNAYCMPGGKIAFYTGILDTLKLTDDEIAMVMGHEIAHALREHGAERAVENLAAQAFILGSTYYAAKKGYNTNTAARASGIFAGLGMLKFSRDDETEADLVGMDIAARAGFDPRAGIALWQKMGAVNKRTPSKWLSTHPAGNDRIAEIRKHLPEVLPLYAKTKGVDANALQPYQSNVKGLPAIQ